MGCVIGGSFHKEYKEIEKTRGYFVRHGIDVIAPKKTKLANDSKKLESYEIEKRFLEDILRAEFYYVVNPDGHISRNVWGEIIWAAGNGIPVYCSRKFKKSSFNSAIVEATLKYTNPAGKDYVKSRKDIVKLFTLR